MASTLLDALKGLGEGLVELAWPTRCAGCDAPGELLCERCRSELPFIDQLSACPRCGAPFGAELCTQCHSPDGEIAHSFSAAVCALEFEDVAAKMVVDYKDGSQMRLARVLAGILADALREQRRACADSAMQGGGTLTASPLLDDVGLLTYVPSSASALRRRGFDHMEGICSELGRELGVECRSLLRKRDVGDQRELGRRGRLRNMQRAFEACGDVRGKLLVVDDVLTTGATLDAAADALIDAGASEVVAACVCRVW